MTVFDPRAYLDRAGTLPDSEIDLALTALALAALAEKRQSVDRYNQHLKKLAGHVADSHAAYLQAGGEDNAGTRLAALKDAVCLKNGYRGDTQNYDDLANASLPQVIDRRRGLPISLAILAIHAGRAQGWEVHGLNMPGHFICRLDEGGQRLIFDPFDDFRLLNAPDLRELLKKSAGDKAELSSSYFEPATNRAILIRLQNNIKHRQIAMEDYGAALETIESMRRIDPGEYRLLLDAGVLYAKTRQPASAVASLEDYISKASTNEPARRDAQALLEELRAALR